MFSGTDGGASGRGKLVLAWKLAWKLARKLARKLALGKRRRQGTVNGADHIGIVFVTEARA